MRSKNRSGQSRGVEDDDLHRRDWKHRHVHLMNGRAKAAQQYPDELCRAVCRGLKQQITADKQGQFLVAQLCDSDGVQDHETKKTIDAMLKECATVEEDDGDAGDTSVSASFMSPGPEEKKAEGKARAPAAAGGGVGDGGDRNGCGHRNGRW